MLVNILRIIDREGYISRSQIARELNIYKDMVAEGIDELLRRGYLVKEGGVESCSAGCAGCTAAEKCDQEVVKVFKISEKGRRYLKNRP